MLMPITLLRRLRRCIAHLCCQHRLGLEEATDIACESLAACLCYLRDRYPDEPADGLLRYLEPGFLEAVVRKRVADHYRRQRCERRAIAECAKELSVPDPQQQALTLLRADEIWDALPENCWEVVHLRVYEQYSWNEIAQATGLSVSAAKMRFQRGIEQARKNLGVPCDESPPTNDLSIGSAPAGETAYTVTGGEDDHATTDLPLEHRPHAGVSEPGTVAHHCRQPRARRGGH